MYYIGIDLGGTNIKGALVSETGEIAREVSRPTRVELGAEAVHVDRKRVVIDESV